MDFSGFSRRFASLSSATCPLRLAVLLGSPPDSRDLVDFSALFESPPRSLNLGDQGTHLWTYSKSILFFTFWWSDRFPFGTTCFFWSSTSKTLRSTKISDQRGEPTEEMEEKKLKRCDRVDLKTLDEMLDILYWKKRSPCTGFATKRKKDLITELPDHILTKFFQKTGAVYNRIRKDMPWDIRDLWAVHYS